MKVKVLELFRDKFTKQLYNAGEELEIEDKARVDDLVSRELVKIIEDKKESDPILISLYGKEFEKKVVLEALKSIGEKIAWNMKDETIISNVAALDEEKAKALKTALEIEE